MLGLKSRKSERGQVALLLILVMVVISAIVVSMSSRVGVEQKSDQLNKEGLIALRGAETGVESVLGGGSLTNNQLVDGAKFDVIKTDEGTGGFESTDLIQPGDVIQINTDGSTATQLYLCWSSFDSTSAVKVSKYDSNSDVVYTAFDSVVGRSAGFSLPADNVLNCPAGFSDKVSITISVGSPRTISVRVLVLYFPTRLAVIPVGGLLPSQQTKISSLGTYEKTNVQRRVELTKDAEKTPSIFDNVLFSRGNISK